MEAQYTYDARLVRVIDADTVVLDIDVGFSFEAKRMRLRLFGINAPEMNTVAGREATTFVSYWFVTHPRLVVRTIKDKTGAAKADSFGRYLAEVYAAGPEDTASLSEILMEAGHAVRYVP